LHKKVSTHYRKYYIGLGPKNLARIFK